MLVPMSPVPTTPADCESGAVRLLIVLLSFRLAFFKVTHILLGIALALVSIG
jgi:hypothetical protein